jgi:hypothetical protein
VHEDQVVVTSLTLELITQLVDAAREGDIAKLKEIIRDGFSDSYVLNNSFLKVPSHTVSFRHACLAARLCDSTPSTQDLDVIDDEDITVVDLEAAAEAYRLIIELVCVPSLPDRVRVITQRAFFLIASFVLRVHEQERAPLLHTLENATELVVSRLSLRKQSITCTKELRQVMILLEVSFPVRPLTPCVLALETCWNVSSHTHTPDLEFRILWCCMANPTEGSRL